MINHRLLNFTDITVGWEQSSFVVSEDIDTFCIFYSIIVPTNTIRLSNPFFMRVATVIGTAGEKLFFVCTCNGKLLQPFCSCILLFIQRYHSNLPLIFLISHAQLISPRSVHITRLISNAVCSTTSLTWKRVNS